MIAQHLAPSGSSGSGARQVPGCVSGLHWVIACAQPWPEGQVPHSPPQPSSPHSLPVQSVVQVGRPCTPRTRPWEVLWQARACSSQVSWVHAAPSSHADDPGTHLPLAKRSSPSQKAPLERVTSTCLARASRHGAARVQGPAQLVQAHLR